VNGELTAVMGPKPEDEGTARLGMIVFLASWAMMFGSLFFAYGVLRLRMSAWPPPGATPLPLGVPLLNTAVLLGSSAALERSVRQRTQHLMGRSARRWLGLTVALGLLFVGLQLELWWGLLRTGLHWGQGTLAAVVYGLTVFHALHVLVGLVGLGTVWAAERPRLLSWRLWTTYWHFVSVVWAGIFLVVFLV
jgi:heme/copper-type cytochrome/quinol oxidase subunit 3